MTGVVATAFLPLAQLHFRCPDCRVAAQAALFLFPFVLLALVLARRPWWMVALLFGFLTWLAAGLAAYLVGAGWPVPRLKSFGGMWIGVLAPVIALWSQPLAPGSSIGRFCWIVFRWQAAGLVAAALVPLVAAVLVALFGPGWLGINLLVAVFLEVVLAAFALPVTLPALGVWLLLARRYSWLEGRLWVRLVALAAYAVLVAAAAALAAFWPGSGDAEPRARAGMFLPAALLVLLTPRLVVPSLRGALPRP